MKVTAPPIPPQALSDPHPGAQPRHAQGDRARVLAATVFKEGRELGPWALLGCLVMSICVALVMNDAAKQSANRYGHWTIALSEPFLLLTLFGPPIAAVLLGFLQFIREMGTSQFGLLMQRPVSRRMLFLTKLGCGMGMYLVAMGVPLAVGTWWASRTENIPLPFSWNMALIPLADVLCGLSYFAAGALVAVRRDARWYGSRLVPVLAPVIASFMNFLAPTFAWSLLATAIALLLLIATGLGHFRPASQYHRQSLWARFAGGVVLMVSLYALLGLCALGLDLVDQNFFRRSGGTGKSFERAIRPDGTPVIVSYDNATNSTSVLDPYGKVLESKPGAEEYYSSKDIRRPSALMSRRNDSPYYNPRPFFHDSSHYVSVAADMPDIRWYYPREATYVIGYDRTHRRYVGAIGRNGLEPGARVARAKFADQVTSFIANSYTPYAVGMFAMPGPALWTGLLSGDTLYQLSDDSTIHPFYTTPDHETILAATTLMASGRDDHGVSQMEALVVMTTSHVRLVRWSDPSKEIGRVEGQFNSGRWIAVESLPSRNEYLVEIPQDDNYPSSAAGAYTMVYVNGTTGAIRKLELPPFSYPTVAGRTRSLPRQIEQSMIPPGLLLVELLYAIDRYPDRAFTFIGNVYLRAGFWTSLAVAAAGTVITMLLARRQLLPWRAIALWCAVSFFCGPVGPLLFLFTRGLSRATTCASCHKRRPLGRAACPHCAAAFPEAALNGTEIFA